VESNKSHLFTPIGFVSVITSNTVVQAILFDDDYAGEENIVDATAFDVKKQLNEYFSGLRKNFDLNLQPIGTDFQKAVWQKLLEIPYGKTISYHQQALKMGDIKAIRAVASANGKNPVAIVIPCHRVVGSDGSLTGYAGGLERKRKLLELELGSKQESLFEE
jgi:methylated-DNA-[protein]-cysteine S-methyltransferase